MFYTLFAAVCLAVLVYVFYRNLLMFLLLLPFTFFYPATQRESLKKKRMDKLRVQFKDAILSVSSGLNAGYSIEHAFESALRETERIHGKDSMICAEIRQILYKVRVNMTFETALMDFADRSGIEDVRNFAEVFIAARDSGGKLMNIIARTANMISEKIRVREDILTSTASRMTEQKVMTVIPVLIVFYIDLTSPGFFDALYTTMAGRIVSTACLAVYLASIKIASSFMEIEV